MRWGIFRFVYRRVMYSRSMRLLFFYTADNRRNILYGHAPRQCELASEILFTARQLWKMHSTCRKDPYSTESVEEAALKASGPMPRALLIVTSAFLSSNSDWWARRGGGGILQRRRGASGGEKLCVRVPSLLSEGWHGASRDPGPLVLWVWTLA